MAQPAGAAERQITFAPQNHNLDNNDNFSPDGRFLVYDTRETIGPGIENSQSIEKVEIATGARTILYSPRASVTGKNAAPGIAAASYCPVADKVAFIHGPLVDDVPARGYYGKPNRNGAEVPGDGSGVLTWLDRRDVDTSRPTLPGAHRGGTHRHEYTLDGKRIGFTYDDFLLPQYDRTIGYMEPRADAPGGATHWFALLLSPPPMGKSKPGEIEKAYGDSWVGRDGRMRAFIGKVRNDDGMTYTESLFVADVPLDVDITTADAGAADRYPSPPKGITIRRLTHTMAEGVIRGAPDGSRIAYYAKDEDGSKQVFVIASDGSDRDRDPAKRPVQVTRLPGGVTSGLRWHPSADYVLCISNGGVAVTCAKPGPEFGVTKFITPQNDGPARIDLVVSLDGKQLAFTKQVPTKDAAGNLKRNYAGLDFAQIFVMDFTWPE
ncbi:MAG TPA: DUF3748 domain-containing protein [Candidatus Bathyarchaeia archaeon]|nr:DUF3748 domain-containing protein [Candidatus Bathyarchaeia archaeon]